MDEKSKKFWDLVEKETSTKGRWLRFVDEIEYVVEIDDWTIHKPDTKYGKQEAIKTVNGKFLGVSAVYIQNLLKKYVGKHIRFTFIRHDSKPDSSQTWGEVTNILIKDEESDEFYLEEEEKDLIQD
ncbi:unnamed protein product [marine sediment metagenome]|uniref:Uncharacterized protein n=1 Tax=marine sediment metagenome TaxID=412755 RepID=X1N0G3_9ZZZZ